MAYCPLLKTYGGRERHREWILVFHLRHCASILQFPVWVLSRATWNCTPAKLHAAPSAHLLLFHLCFYFSLSLTFTLSPCLCNVVISMLRTSKALPGHQSLRQSVSCLTVSQSADLSPSSHCCWITHSIARLIAQPLTHSVSHLFFFNFLPTLAPLCCTTGRTYILASCIEELASAHFSPLVKSQKCLFEQLLSAL